MVILGAPRSGTTMVYAALCRHPELWNVGGESHAILEGPLHPALAGWSSNAVGAGYLDAAGLEQLRRRFVAAARHLDGRLSPDQPAIRLLEKTPKNALRVPLLRELFPDARYLVLHREAPATVASLITGWQAPGRYESYDLPVRLAIPGYAGRRWCFLLPPGWRRLTGRPLAEVCAAQYRAAAQALASDLGPERAGGRVVDVHYERLVNDPEAELRRACPGLALDWDPALLEADGGLPVVNTVAPPAPDKWRMDEAEALSVLAAVEWSSTKPFR